MLRRRSLIMFATAAGVLMLVFALFQRTSRPELDKTTDSLIGEEQMSVSPINDTVRFRRIYVGTDSYRHATDTILGLPLRCTTNTHRQPSRFRMKSATCSKNVLRFR